MKVMLLLSLILLVGCRTALPQLEVPRIASTPVIDGNPSDWATAAYVTGLQPFIGGDYQARLAELPTRLQVAWNPSALYIAFNCTDPDVYLKPREGVVETSLHRGDLVEVFIDPQGTERQWYELQVNPLGQIFDKIFLLAAEPAYEPTGRLTETMCTTRLWTFDQGFSLDGVSVATQRTANWWCVEMAIPAKHLTRHLGTDLLAPMTLRANFARYKWDPDREKGGRRLLGMLWSPVQPGCPHISPSRHGYLHLVD